MARFVKDEQCTHCLGLGTMDPPPPPPSYHKFEIWVTKQSESFFSKFRDGSPKPSLGCFNNVRLPLNSVADCLRVLELAEMDKSPWVWYISEHKSEHDTFGTRVMEHPLVARIENDEKLDHAESMRESEDFMKRLNSESRVLELKIDADNGVYIFRLERSLAKYDSKRSACVHKYAYGFLRNPAGEEWGFDPGHYYTRSSNLRTKDLKDDLIGFRKVDKETTKAIIKLMPTLSDLKSRFEHGNLTADDRKLEVPLGSVGHTVRSDKGAII